MNRPPFHDDQLRALHAEAVAAISPATRAALRAARHSTRVTRPHRTLWLAASGAGVLALAVGIGLRPADTPVPATAPMVAVLEDSTATPALDENPDLYLWLGNDPLALE